MIESKIYNNAHFYGLHCDEPASKYQRLKAGEKRTQSPKATLILKPIKPKDEDHELANVVARKLARASQRIEKVEGKKEAKKEVRKGKETMKEIEVPATKRARSQRKALTAFKKKPYLCEIEEEEVALAEMREDVPLIK